MWLSLKTIHSTPGSRSRSSKKMRSIYLKACPGGYSLVTQSCEPYSRDTKKKWVFNLRIGAPNQVCAKSGEGTLSKSDGSRRSTHNVKPCCSRSGLIVSRLSSNSILNHLWVCISYIHWLSSGVPESRLLVAVCSKSYQEVADKPARSGTYFLSGIWLGNSEYPKVALERHADFAACKTISRQHYKGARDRSDGWDKAKHRDPFMWPYINQEDLSKPKALPLLLNARGRHSPGDFAAADVDALRLGKTSNAIVPICVKHNTMILSGATGPNEYGRLLAWQTHPHAFDWLRSWKQFDPQEGFMILEAQDGLLSFLVDCCKYILHDISEDATISDKYQIKEEPQLKSEAERTGFDSLAVMMAEEPYRVPAHMDLKRMEVLLAARASAAEDHLWSLREDPGYFSETLWDFSEHRVELFKDESRRAHPALDRANRSVFWARVAGEVLFNAYYELEIFSELHKQARDLRVLQSKHAGAISPSKDLPTDYLRAIFKFRHFLDRASMMPIG